MKICNYVMLSEATYCSLRSRNIARKGAPRLVFFLLQYVIVAEWYFVEKKGHNTFLFININKIPL